MLRNAALYKNELNQLIQLNYYNEKYKFLSGGPVFENIIKIHDNNESEPYAHQFVSVGQDGRVIGYIGYYINYSDRTAHSFQMVNFHDPSVTFTNDVLQVVKNCFYKFGINRMEFRCLEGNPALELYRKFIAHFGGRECGHFHEATITWDGVARDVIVFEILKNDIKEK